MVTFKLQRRQPPPEDPPIYGSLIVEYQSGPDWYFGEWETNGDYFVCYFKYKPGPITGQAWGYWSAGPHSDHGDFPVETIDLPPLLKYEAFEVQADNWDWWVRIKITS